jgi:hypothetical protein
MALCLANLANRVVVTEGGASPPIPTPFYMASGHLFKDGKKVFSLSSIFASWI